jgi:hypothetical protein
LTPTVNYLTSLSIIDRLQSHSYVLIFHRVKCLLLLFFLCAVSIPAFSQDSRVLVEKAIFSSSIRPVILLKWYSQELIYPEGVNVYRREEGTLAWTKLNEQPIRKKSAIGQLLLKGDPDLETFVRIIQSASAEDLKQEIIQFNLLVKSFQSNVFADFMGIYHKDSTVENGKKYEYKVNRIKNGRESLLGVSSLILAGAYTSGESVQDVKILQKNKKINLNWKQEEERFYAVNIYRKNSADTLTVKLNKNPLMLSQITDATGKVTYPDPMFSEDLKLEEGKMYTYQIAGVGFFGHETLKSPPVEVLFKDVTPPLSPIDLTGKADSMKVYLNWKPRSKEEAVKQIIYRSRRSDGIYNPINFNPLNAEASQYLDTLTVAGPYYYYVSAADIEGNEAHSDLIFVEVQDVIPPETPQNLLIRADTGRVYLNWKMNEEADLAGYHIYRTVNKDQKKNYVLLNAKPLKANEFSEKLPKNVKNKFFYFLVAADTSFNRSKPSFSVSAAMPDVLAPEKPFIRNVSYSGSDILIEWLPNVDSDLAGYQIYRSDTSKKFTRQNVNMLGKSTFRYTDRSNEANTDYFYYLVAMDSAGNSSVQSNERYGRRVEAATTEESKITFKMKLLKGKKSIQLTWQQETDESILGYVIYRGIEENNLMPISGLIKEKKYTDKIQTADAKQLRYYQVRSYRGQTITYSPVIKVK